MIQKATLEKQSEAVAAEDAVEVLIVIVCYRVVELTISCLRTLELEVQDIPGIRVAVCENGTGAEAVEQLRECITANGWDRWVTLLSISPNVGFTGGNNAVLRAAMSWARPPKYFILLNADTEVARGATKTLYDAIERRPEVGIMGPVMLAADGAQQDSRFRDHTPVSEFLRGAGTGIINRMLFRKAFQLAPSDGISDYDWVSFACAIIRSSVVGDIGFLDEGYFLYYDDADYCRMARKRGWKIGFCGEAFVTHLEGQSNQVPEKARRRERRPKYYYVSRSRYFAKHIGTVGLWLANIAWLAGAVVSSLKRLISDRAPNICEGEWKDIWTNAGAPVRNSNASLVPKESRVIL